MAGSVSITDDTIGADSRRPSHAAGVRPVILRFAAAVFVLWGAVTVTFVALSVLPGDRATIILNITSGQAIERTPAELAPINRQYGFDEPMIVQYTRYISGLLCGNFGTSYELQRPVTTIIGEQIGPTFALAIAALVLAWVFAVPWTLLTAGRGKRLGSVGSATETITAGLPHYWVGVLLLIVFAIHLRWFPVIGGTSFMNTVLPTVTLALPLAGFLGQSIRSEFDRTMREPFVLSARTRGMSASGVRARHVLRHALIPAITLSGWAIGSLLSGAVLVESVFARPGLGAVLVSAVSDKDFPLVAGIVILNAFLYVVINLIVDLIYLIVDPRMRGDA